MLILGFGHKARNGKDTAAEAIRDFYWKRNEQLVNSFGKSAPQTSVGIFKFADALYAEVNQAIKDGIWKHRRLGTPGVDEHAKPVITLPDWVQPESNPQVSSLAPLGKHPKLLQWWGTEYRRQHFGQNYWVEKMFASIPSGFDVALVSDMRFPNEAEAIKQRGGYTVHVQRLNRDGSQYFASDRPVDHPSEVGLDGYNYDYFIKIKEGDFALTSQQAITLAEYLKGIQS